jgi:hypothetical protein
MKIPDLVIDPKDEIALSFGIHGSILMQYLTSYKIVSGYNILIIHATFFGDSESWNKTFS